MKKIERHLFVDEYGLSHECCYSLEVDALEAELEKRDGVCEWEKSRFEGIDWYIPECNQNEAFFYDDYGVIGKKFKYCPYCGKIIKATLPPPSQEDEG